MARGRGPHAPVARLRQERPRHAPPARALKEPAPYIFHREGKSIGDFRRLWDRACAAHGLEGLLSSERVLARARTVGDRAGDRIGAPHPRGWSAARSGRQPEKPEKSEQAQKRYGVRHTRTGQARCHRRWADSFKESTRPCWYGVIHRIQTPQSGIRSAPTASPLRAVVPSRASARQHVDRARPISTHEARRAGSPCALGADKANVRQIRIHDLRHTYASLIIAQGESLAYIREQTGHHSIRVTVDTYGHLVPGGNKAAVDRLDDVPDATNRNPAATATRRS